MFSNTTSVSSKHTSVASGSLRPVKRLPPFLRSGPCTILVKDGKCSHGIMISHHAQSVWASLPRPAHSLPESRSTHHRQLLWLDDRATWHPRSGMVNWPIVGGMRIYPIGFDWTGTEKCFVDCSSGVSYYQGGRGVTLSCSEVANGAYRHPRVGLPCPPESASYVGASVFVTHWDNKSPSPEHWHLFLLSAPPNSPAGVLLSHLEKASRYACLEHGPVFGSYLYLNSWCVLSA